MSVRRAWVALLSVLSLVLAFWPSVAAAQGKASSVHVINLDSDDATEDNADGFTAALKSRLRSTPGWQLVESQNSLSTLGPALRCPAKPDAACLQRIADQLKTDRFFWGRVGAGTGAHMVTAEVHLWVRGKAEQVVKESYAENLKDQNDEALRKVVASVLQKLTGVASEGTVNVKANADEGTVLVDGKPAGQLDHGQVTLTLSGGAHIIEVQGKDTTSGPQQVTVVTGSEVSIAVELHPGAVTPPPPVETPGKPAPVMKIIGFSTMGVGLVLGVVGLVEGIQWWTGSSDFNSDTGKYKAYASSHYGSLNPNWKYCDYPTDSLMAEACDKKKSLDGAAVLGYALGGGGVVLMAVGAILVASDHSGSASSEEPPKAGKLRVTPAFGPHGGGMNLSLTF
jgi:hypothetical protein